MCAVELVRGRNKKPQSCGKGSYLYRSLIYVFKPSSISGGGCGSLKLALGVPQQPLCSPWRGWCAGACRRGRRACTPVARAPAYRQPYICHRTTLHTTPTRREMIRQRESGREREREARCGRAFCILAMSRVRQVSRCSCAPRGTQRGGKTGTSTLSSHSERWGETGTSTLFA